MYQLSDVLFFIYCRSSTFGERFEMMFLKWFCELVLLLLLLLQKPTPANAATLVADSSGNQRGYYEALNVKRVPLCLNVSCATVGDVLVPGRGVAAEAQLSFPSSSSQSRMAYIFIDHQTFKIIACVTNLRCLFRCV